MKKQCGRCGKDIPKERLEVLPETSLCIKCSEAVGGDFELSIVEENLGNTVISNPVILKIPKEVEPIQEDE